MLKDRSKILPVKKVKMAKKTIPNVDKIDYRTEISKRTQSMNL
jgi:hypothetical protein